MFDTSQNTNFKGIYGSYVKNNRIYPFNIKKSNTFLAITKKDDGLNQLSFFRMHPRTSEERLIKNIDGVQKVNIDLIEDESGVVLNSDETFHIKETKAYDNFVELSEKAKVIIDKLESCIFYVNSKKGSSEQRAFIKEVTGLEVRNSATDNKLDIYKAKNLILSDSNVDEKIAVQAEDVSFSSVNKVNILM